MCSRPFFFKSGLADDTQVVMEDMMKNLRRICLGFLLIVALSAPAFAGDIQTPGFAGPQESPGITGPQESPGLTGDIQAPGFAGDMGTPVAIIIITNIIFGEADRKSTRLN